MKTDFNIKHLGIFLAIVIFLVGTVIFAGFSVIPSTAGEVDVALIGNGNLGIKWEYKSVLLAPGADQILNTQVSDVNWEYLGSTNDYALFRRVAAEQ